MPPRPTDTASTANKLDLIMATLEQILATLDQILAEVVDENVKIDALATIVAGIKGQLAAALANVTLPEEVQAKIDAVLDGVGVNKAAIVAVIDANTPHTP